MEYAAFDQKHYNMAKIARTMAFIAIISALFQTIVLPFIFGGLAIIFAVLSKGNTQAYSMPAKTSIIIGVFAIIFNIGLIVFTVYYFMHDPKAIAYLNDTSMQLYGMSWNEMMQQLQSSSGQLQ